MSGGQDRVEASKVQGPDTREWRLPQSFGTQLCKHCGGSISFIREGRRTWCLDVDKGRMLKNGRWMAPLHLCQRGVGSDA